jgi:peptidoglycan/LPS O-acetylase OafA/YrhL
MGKSSFVTHEDFLRTKYFPSLDGLRCISILMVVGFHARLTGIDLFRGGPEGVSLFFVISGFLITTLLLRERARYGEISLPDFYVRRTLRIFPLYYAAIALYTVAVLTTQKGEDRTEFFTNLPAYFTYTNNWFVDRFAGERVIFAFAWSLATEEQFYLVWPWIVRFAKKWWVPVVVIALALFGDMVMEILVAKQVLSLSTVKGRLLTSVASPICLGCILAYVLHYPKGFVVARYAVGAKWSAPFALVLLATAFVYEEELWKHGVHEIVVYPLMVLVVGSVCARTDNWLTWLLANPVTRYIGTISYGMYLLHMLCLNAARVMTKDRSWPFLILATALTIGVASLSYWLYERRFLKLKDKFSHRTGKAHTSIPSTPPEATPEAAPMSAPTTFPAPVTAATS